MLAASPSSMGLRWLADVTLQSTAIMMLAWLIILFRPRLAAARRCLVLALGLLAVPVLMLVTALLPQWHWLQVPASFVRLVASPVAALPPVLQRPAAIAHVDSAAPRDPVFPDSASSSFSLGAISLAVWLAGIAVGGIGLILSSRRLAALRRDSSSSLPPSWAAAFEQAVMEMDVRRPVDLRLGNGAEGPMTWGLRRPVILLPNAARQWHHDRLLLVLRHELAHIARNDAALTLPATLAASWLWFHPLAWLTLRGFSQAREAACDDLALTRGDMAPDAFASQLLQAVASCNRVHRLMPLALGMAAADKRALQARLAAIMDDDQRREPWSRRSALTLSTFALAVVFALGGLTACREAKEKLAHVPLVYLSSKVFTLPLSSTLLADFGLSLGQSSSVSNLGILSEQRAAALLKKLGETPSVKLLSAPSVTTRSGQKAKVEIVREFIYPTAFDPPKVPETTKDKPLILTGAQSYSVTPTTPTAFETRNVGVMMEFEPEIQDHGRIALNASPEVTQFLGFVNYGTPIMVYTSSDGKVTQNTLSENRVPQPVFRTARCSTSALLNDGECLVMGGMGFKGDADQPLGSQKLMLSQDKEPDLTKDDNNEFVFFVVQARICK